MKKYVVRLTGEERKLGEGTIDRLNGSSQKARRASGVAESEIRGRCRDWSPASQGRHAGS